MKKKKFPLHLQILAGIAAGVLVGILFLQFSWGKSFVIDWIKPWGTIFINLLKLIAIPLIITSLVKGIADLKDVSQLSRMGWRTMMLYLSTTVLAVSVGLVLVNLIKPGNTISEQTRTELLDGFSQTAELKMEEAASASQRGPLQPLIDVVPENIFEAAASNSNMLQVIFFTLLAAVCIALIPEKKAAPVKALFDGANEVVMKMVDVIMYAAPYGVLSLIAALIVESPSAEIFWALGLYGLTVILGLAAMIFIVYGLLLRFFGKSNPWNFLRKLAPAQLVAFSTSSSAATLPVTMERVEEHVGVNKEVSSFVLPIGATINMDGTCLYQGVAAVFIAQVFGYDLTLADQLSIVFTATLASIGSAAVPGAGLLMLIIVLESIGVNPAGIALIFAVDRPLDMCRTVVNVTGDSTVAVLINRWSGYELIPQPGAEPV